MTKINTKMTKLWKIDPNISKKCVNYYKIPSKNKKCGTCPQNPNADPQSFCAPCA